MKKFMIYYDSASTAYYLDETLQTQVMKEALGNPFRSSSEPSTRAMGILENTRMLICNHIQADHPKYVAFTSGTTQSMNFLLDAYVPCGAKIVTSFNEHNSVYRPLNRQCRYKNCTVQYVKNRPSGKIDLNHLESLLKNKDVFAVIVNHASNVTGVVQDLDKISALCMKYDSFFFVDAAQSIGFCKIDMRNNHIDAVAFSGHKRLGALMGTGVLAVSERLNKSEKFEAVSGGTGNLSFDMNQPLEMPTFFEAGTPNMPGILSLMYAFQIQNTDNSINYENNMKVKHDMLRYTKTFRDKIKNLDGFKVYGPTPKLKTENDEFTNLPIMAFNYCDLPSVVLENYLHEHLNIACRSGILCAPLIHKFYGTEDQGILRFSFSHFNTLEEMVTVLDILRQVKKSF